MQSSFTVDSMVGTARFSSHSSRPLGWPHEPLLLIAPVIPHAVLELNFPEIGKHLS